MFTATRSGSSGSTIPCPSTRTHPWRTQPRQGKFWEYHDKLFANQKALKPENLEGYAQELGLDMEKFRKDLANTENSKRIDADKAEAQSLQATGTPAFFVNGRYLRGAKPFEEFAKVINAELTRLNLPVPSEAQGS
jgi:protein-disulfide isomerase